MIFKLIITNLILILAHSKLYKHSNAFNLSCFKDDPLLNQKYQKDDKIYFSLKTFYIANLFLDLRHINKNNDFGDKVRLTVQIINKQRNNDNIYQENLPFQYRLQNFQIQASNNLQITAFFNISGENIHEIQSIEYMLQESLRVDIIEPNSIDYKKSFLFVITNKDEINLPFNIVDRQEIEPFPGYFINKIPDNSSLRSSSQKIKSYSQFWNEHESLVFPFLPYFSNCIDSGLYLNFAQITNNKSQCNLYGSQTIPISQFNFGSQAKADNCNIVRQCVYDQIPQENSQYPFWNTLDRTDLTLFYITKQQHPRFSLTNSFDETNLIPCKLMQTGGTNNSDLYPKKIMMQLGYYQITNTQKLMMSCQIKYGLFVQSHPNFTYTLEIQYQPLSHTIVLLNFGFKWYVYMIVFIIIGLISNFQFLLFWGYHLIVTIKPKINLSFLLFLRLCKGIFKGFLPATLIIVLMTFIVQILMQGTIFGNRMSMNYASFWDYATVENYGHLADIKLQSVRSSRMGLSFIVVSLYIMILLSELLIGHERSKQEYDQYEILGRKFKPKEWNRGKLLFVTFVYIFTCIAFIYFTRTELFNSYIWHMIVMMQVLQMIIEKVVLTIYQDMLPALPFKITLGVLSYLATMGAIDLYYFILGYLVDVGIATIELIYLSGLQDMITQFIIQKSQELNKFYISLLHDQEQQNDKKSDKDDDQQNQVQVLISNSIEKVQIIQQSIQEQHNQIQSERFISNETDAQKQAKCKFLQYLLAENKDNKKQKIQEKKSSKKDQQEQQRQIQNNKFGLLIDGTIGMLQYMIQPVIVLILWITFKTSNILKEYGISEVNCILYFLSSVILAIFFQLNIIILLHVAQLYFNFDYKKLVTRLLDNFQNKKYFWITQQIKQEQDQIYQLELRGINNYSMSSQMYFIITLYVCCMYFFIVGFNTIISAKHNVLEDTFMMFIFGFWIIILLACRFLIKKVLYVFNIWGYSSLSQENKQLISISQDQQKSDFDEYTTGYLKKQQLSDSSIKFTFKQINFNKQLTPQNQKKTQQQQKMILSSKLNTICKNLEQDFKKTQFQEQYSKKNKQFIKNNIQKILPMISQFADDDIDWFEKDEQDKDKVKKVDNKNANPLVIEFLADWAKRVQFDRAKRQRNGGERQKMLKKCHFCYNSWGIYYGYQGMCLQCNRKLIQSNKSKQD